MPANEVIERVSKEIAFAICEAIGPHTSGDWSCEQAHPIIRRRLQPLAALLVISNSVADVLDFCIQNLKPEVAEQMMRRG